MDASSGRWRFWDFGCLQFVQNTLTGELVIVHGKNAVFGDGPFKFALFDDGRPVVVGLEGGDDDCALHLVDEVMAKLVTLEPDVKGQWHHMVKSRCGEKPARALIHIQDEKEVLHLVCEVPGHASFKSQFTRYAAPEMVGECVVQLWLHFEWLVEYVDGKAAQRRKTRLVEKLRSSLKRHGLSHLHVVDSLLSRQRRRRQNKVADADDDVDGDQAWRVSMVGVFVYLFDKLDLRKTTKPTPTDDAAKSQLTAESVRARVLLKALLSWPLVGGDSIGVVCRRAEYKLLFDGLAAKPPCREAKRRKITAFNAYYCRLLGRWKPPWLWFPCVGPPESTRCGEKPEFSDVLLVVRGSALVLKIVESGC